MYRPFACEIIFLIPYGVDIMNGDVLRRAARALAPFDGKSFVPRTSRTRAFLDGEGSAARITFDHPDFDEAHGCADCGLSLGVGENFHKGLDLVMLTVQLGRGEEQIETSWRASCQLVPPIIDALGPNYAFANGKRVDNERSPVPSPKALDHPFPNQLTALNYLGAGSLRGIERSALAAVTCYRSEPLGDGWLLQAVRSLEERPPKDFLPDCQAIVGHALRYLPPLAETKG